MVLVLVAAAALILEDHVDDLPVSRQGALVKTFLKILEAALEDA